MYHLLNRRVMRLPLFEKDDDYAAFEGILAAGVTRPDAPHLLAWCLMPNHWHLVVQAHDDTNLSGWMQWLTVTHTHRWRAHTGTVGEGPLYQGRFKSFPVQTDAHFLTVCRYVEANASRAKLVRRAEAWQWGSLWVRRGGNSPLRSAARAWPVTRPRNWLEYVNRPLEEDARKPIQESITRGMPLGDESWKTSIAGRLGLHVTLRPRGRPRGKKVSG